MAQVGGRVSATTATTKVALKSSVLVACAFILRGITTSGADLCVYVCALVVSVCVWLVATAAASVTVAPDTHPDP